jgi:hypothetical protein
MSFAQTTPQIRARTKMVTRRVGWATLHAGVDLQAVVQAQGLPKGAHIERLAVIRVEAVRREPLDRLTAEADYGRAEMILEGFPGLDPAEFVRIFARTHDCNPTDIITRIEFSYPE